MNVTEQAQLADLGFHWGHAYHLSVCDGVWRASPLAQPADVLTARTADELRLMIRQHYRGPPHEGCSL
jgi:hypothetical protein